MRSFRPASRGWARCRRGQILRIVDLEGNQAVDTLFYNAHDTAEHYSAQNTIRRSAASTSPPARVLLTQPRPAAAARSSEDTCGRHDTLGGACSAESNTVRYALEKRHMHNCRDSFLLALARQLSGRGSTKRDLPTNINFFMNVPVTPAGGLRFADGISAAGPLRRAARARWTCWC